MKRQIVPLNQSSIANTLHNIGIVYKNLRKYEDALKYYNQSLEMKKQTLPSNHPSIAQTLNNIGFLYKDQGKTLRKSGFFIIYYIDTSVLARVPR